MSFRLTYAVQYEGDVNKDFDTLDEVAAWIEQNPSAYDFDIGNVDVIEIKGGVDVFALMEKHRAQKELAQAGFPPEVLKASDEARAAGLFQVEPPADLPEQIIKQVKDKLGE